MEGGTWQNCVGLDLEDMERAGMTVVSGWKTQLRRK